MFVYVWFPPLQLSIIFYYRRIPSLFPSFYANLTYLSKISSTSIYVFDVFPYALHQAAFPSAYFYLLHKSVSPKQNQLFLTLPYVTILQSQFEFRTKSYIALVSTKASKV